MQFFQVTWQISKRNNVGPRYHPRLTFFILKPKILYNYFIVYFNALSSDFVNFSLLLNYTFDRISWFSAAYDDNIYFENMRWERNICIARGTVNLNNVKGRSDCLFLSISNLPYSDWCTWRRPGIAFDRLKYEARYRDILQILWSAVKIHWKLRLAFF